MNPETLSALSEIVPQRRGAMRQADGVLAALDAEHGTAVLEQESVRLALYGLMAPDELRSWAERFAKKRFPKPADNALVLARLPWRSRHDLALATIQWLGLGPDYLPTIDHRAPTVTSVESFSCRPPLRDYQDEVRLAILNRLASGDTKLLVQMPTGAGKTRTAMDALVAWANRGSLFAHGRAILWLAHVEELCEQAAQAFESSWREIGDGTASVVRFWGQHKPSVADCAGGFVVSTYQKLASMRSSSPEEIGALADLTVLVVADEAHKAVAPSFRASLDEFSRRSTAVIGLSATPGRGLEQIGENARLASFFDRNLISPSLGEEPISELRRRGVLAAINYSVVESGVSVDLSAGERESAAAMDLPGSVMSRLARSVPRNRAIVKVIEDEVSAGRSCLVFACSVEHSKLLVTALRLIGVRAGHIDADVPRRERRMMVNEIRSREMRVLSNFGVLSTGLDVPQISTVVITRPTTSVVLYSQMVGRGLRGPSSGGNAECNLVDVRDNFTAFGAVDSVYNSFKDYWR